MLRSAFETARTGLATESLRVQVAANNIANANSEDYTPQRVEQTTLSGSRGVQATVQAVPTNISGGEPRVDLVREATTLLQAKAAYQANLAVIVAVEDMTDSLFEIFDDNRDDRDRRDA